MSRDVFAGPPEVVVVGVGDTGTRVAAVMSRWGIPPEMRIVLAAAELAAIGPPRLLIVVVDANDVSQATRLALSARRKNTLVVALVAGELGPGDATPSELDAAVDMLVEVPTTADHSGHTLETTMLWAVRALAEAAMAHNVFGLEKLRSLTRRFSRAGVGVGSSREVNGLPAAAREAIESSLLAGFPVQAVPWLLAVLFVRPETGLTQVGEAVTIIQRGSRQLANVLLALPTAPIIEDDMHVVVYAFTVPRPGPAATR